MSRTIQEKARKAMSPDSNSAIKNKTLEALSPLLEVDGIRGVGDNIYHKILSIDFDKSWSDTDKMKKGMCDLGEIVFNAVINHTSNNEGNSDVASQTPTQAPTDISANNVSQMSIGGKRRKGGGAFEMLSGFERIRGQRYDKWLEQRLVLVHNDTEFVNKVRKRFGYDKTNIVGRGQLTKKMVEDEVCSRSEEERQLIDPSLKCDHRGGKRRKTRKRRKRLVRKKKRSRRKH